MNLEDTRLSQISHKETISCNSIYVQGLGSAVPWRQKAERGRVMSAARQFETFPSSVSFTLQPAEHPQLKDASAQHAREVRTCDCKGGWPGAHGGGGSRETVHGVPCTGFLRSRPLARAAEPREPGSSRRGASGSSLQAATHLQPQATRRRWQWSLGPSSSVAEVPKPWPLPASPTVADPANLTTLDTAEAPLTTPGATSPSHIASSSGACDQGISDTAKGARHANAPAQDTRDTGSLALKTTEAQEATTGAQGNTSEKAVDSGGRGF